MQKHAAALTSSMELNKSYRVIVANQDFIFGRDATALPVNVYDVVDPEQAPTLPQERRYQWDIRLDWSASADAKQAVVSTSN